MKLIFIKAQFMTDILDIGHNLRLKIPQNFGILSICLSFRGRGKQENLLRQSCISRNWD